MTDAPEQHDNSCSEAKSDAEMSEDEVKHLFDALVATLNEEQSSAPVNSKSDRVTQSSFWSGRGHCSLSTWWAGLIPSRNRPPG